MLGPPHSSTQQKGLGCAAGLPAAPKVPQHHPSMRSHPPGVAALIYFPTGEANPQGACGHCPTLLSFLSSPITGGRSPAPRGWGAGPKLLAFLWGAHCQPSPCPPSPQGSTGSPPLSPAAPCPPVPVRPPRPGPAAARSGGLGADSEGKPMCVAPFSEPAAAPC